MKRLHRPDLFGWSRFDESRDIDFHSVLWVRPSGNVVIDPLPLSDHDAAHLESLGGVAQIVVTNSDHVRDARALAERMRARVLGPKAEHESFPIACDGSLGDGDEPVPGLRVFALDGSKTPGELALLIEDTTLLFGDLVRAHQAGSLTLLPDAKLSNRQQALRSVQRLADLPHVEAVLTGDGWPVFRDGKRALRELIARESA
jgi:glyoxylase-like metal-dependent hydrolase (beta-lactamase superfamily II)